MQVVNFTENFKNGFEILKKIREIYKILKF